MPRNKRKGASGDAQQNAASSSGTLTIRGVVQGSLSQCQVSNPFDVAMAALNRLERKPANIQQFKVEVLTALKAVLDCTTGLKDEQILTLSKHVTYCENLCSAWCDEEVIAITDICTRLRSAFETLVTKNGVLESEVNLLKNRVAELEKANNTLMANYEALAFQEKRRTTFLQLGVFAQVCAKVIETRIGTSLRLTTVYKLYEYRMLLESGSAQQIAEHCKLVEKLLQKPKEQVSAVDQQAVVTSFKKFRSSTSTERHDQLLRAIREHESGGKNIQLRDGAFDELVKLARRLRQRGVDIAGGKDSPLSLLGRRVDNSRQADAHVLGRKEREAVSPNVMKQNVLDVECDWDDPAHPLAPPEKPQLMVGDGPLVVALIDAMVSDDEYLIDPAQPLVSPLK